MMTATQLACNLLKAVNQYITESKNTYGRVQAARIYYQRILAIMAQEHVAPEVKIAQLHKLTFQLVKSKLFQSKSALGNQSVLNHTLIRILNEAHNHRTQHGLEVEPPDSTDQIARVAQKHHFPGDQSRGGNNDGVNVVFHNGQWMLRKTIGRSSEKNRKLALKEVMVGRINRQLMGPSYPDYEFAVEPSSEGDVACVYSTFIPQSRGMKVKEYSGSSQPSGFAEATSLAFLAQDADFKAEDCRVTPQGDVIVIDHGNCQLFDRATMACFNMSNKDQLPNLAPVRLSGDGQVWLSQSSAVGRSSACARRTSEFEVASTQLFARAKLPAMRVKVLAVVADTCLAAGGHCPAGFKDKAIERVGERIEAESQQRDAAKAYAAVEDTREILVEEVSWLERAKQCFGDAEQDITWIHLVSGTENDLVSREIIEDLKTMVLAIEDADDDAKFKLFYRLQALTYCLPEVLDRTELGVIYREMQAQPVFQPTATGDGSYVRYAQEHKDELLVSSATVVARNYRAEYAGKFCGGLFSGHYHSNHSKRTAHDLVLDDLGLERKAMRVRVHVRPSSAAEPDENSRLYNRLAYLAACDRAIPKPGVAAAPAPQ